MKNRRLKFAKLGLCSNCGKEREDKEFHLCFKCRTRGNKFRKLWRSKQDNREKELTNSKKYRLDLHLKALKKIALDKNIPLICPICGCDDIKILEINHLLHNGNQERKNLKDYKFYREIIEGTRSTEDLDIRCRICNYIYFLEHKSGNKWIIKFSRD